MNESALGGEWTYEVKANFLALTGNLAKYFLRKITPCTIIYTLLNKICAQILILNFQYTQHKIFYLF